MLIAYNKRKERILAQYADQTEAYYCPICQAPVILRSGCCKVPHFAHRTLSHHKHTGRRESEVHCYLKHKIYELFSKKYNDVQLEPYVYNINQIPDIIVDQYVIEIQLSAISPVDIANRTKGLTSAGYKVIWLTALPRYKCGTYYFNQLQQTCIRPEQHGLYSVDIHTGKLFYLSNIIAITPRQFVAEKHELSYYQLLTHYDSTQYTNNMIRKISVTRILQYIAQCRRKNTVHDEVLSIMYRLQLSDIQVTRITGFIFPEQLYVSTHPVLWQLKLLEAIYYQRSVYDVLSKCMKFRHFAINDKPHPEIINRLSECYRKILKI
ncbi:competence protein CoiA [Staphylococcus sp. 17KM0847]|uniref:competence protein CoiA n=1 Tax=Staphylococcus sp. 17KM0847 TaxID=2583989 RepID=UPI0015DE457C|nr:competence protein CoiA family protein [Staphylococcus sp. 17KM0847]